MSVKNSWHSFREERCCQQDKGDKSLQPDIGDMGTHKYVPGHKEDDYSGKSPSSERKWNMGTMLANQA